MSAAKRKLAEEILASGPLNVHLDPRRDGVVVPKRFRAQPNLLLAVARSGLRIPIPDLVVDDDGIRGTLSFDNTPFACVVPWRAVFALVTDDAKGEVFREDVPADLPKKPPAHETTCSFCLAPRATVDRLVTSPRASICDRCIRLHRPIGFFAQLRARFSRRARAQTIAMPYRDAGCAFCQSTSVPTIAGASAKICGPCLDLARDVLLEAR